MTADRKTAVQFTILTFGIAYIVSGALIFFGRYGYTVYNWVSTPLQFIMNVPFSIYVMSPAIASYIVLRKNGRVKSAAEWLKTVFYVKNSPLVYLYTAAVLALYYTTHVLTSGCIETSLPFYTFFLSLPGNLFIGGLEEAGWMYVLQPALEKKHGYMLSAVITGAIWMLWHIPLFFIPGTSHCAGAIDFMMFNVQLLAFRFVYGGIYRLSGKGGVFMCVLYHCMFNASSPIFRKITATWPGTIAANAAVAAVSIIAVALYDKKHGGSIWRNE